MCLNGGTQSIHCLTHESGTYVPCTHQTLHMSEYHNTTHNKRLTNGLEVVMTMSLHLETSKEGTLFCKFSCNASVKNTSTTPLVKVYVTINLAFQASAQGKESMSTWWCMQ